MSFYKYTISLGGKADNFEVEIPIEYSTLNTLKETIELMVRDGLVNQLELNLRCWGDISDEEIQLRSCIAQVPYLTKYLIMLVFACRTKQWEQIVELMIIIFPKLQLGTVDSLEKLKQLKKFKSELRTELGTLSMLMRESLLKPLLARLKFRPNCSLYRVFSGVNQTYLHVGAFKNVLELHKDQYISNLRRELMSQSPRGRDIELSSVVAKAAQLVQLHDLTLK